MRAGARLRRLGRRLAYSGRDGQRDPRAVVDTFFATLFGGGADSTVAWEAFRDRLFEDSVEFSNELGAHLHGDAQLQMLSVLLLPVVRNAFKDWESQTKFFPIVEALGFHLLPTSFYSPVPELSQLRTFDWSHRYAIDKMFDGAAQVELMRRLGRWQDELKLLPRDADPHAAHRYYWTNPSFGPGDAIAYYALIRELRPARVLEVGGGLSTMIAAEAALRNDPATVLDCIEPYPMPALKKGFPGLNRLMQQPVQEIAPAEFEKLEANDILFIDSTHVAKVGSDVNYLILEILPRIRPGVWVHVHDIYLPWNYDPEVVVGKRLFWNEEYLLLAFLLFNDAFKVELGNCFLSREHYAEVDQIWSELPPYRGASLWLRRV